MNIIVTQISAPAVTTLYIYFNNEAETLLFIDSILTAQ